MFARIVGNTPLWVWPLLLALLWLGFDQTRARVVGLRRILLLPAVMTGLSLSGAMTSFGAGPLVLLVWSIAVCIGTGLAVKRPAVSLARYDPATALFHLPGSWAPLALILGIFSAKYATGATLAMQPALAASIEFSTLVSAVYGVFSGIFVGRAIRLWRLRR